MAVSCGTDDNFPMRLWCQLLPHAEVQLNFLCKSHMQPGISAYEDLNGEHSFDVQPFAILGSAVQIHVIPRNYKTWDTHTNAGYYLGPSWDHYRCHRIWVEDTKSVRVGQTVFFKHKYITMQGMTVADGLLRAEGEVCSKLIADNSDKSHTKAAVDTLMQIFKTNAKKHEPNADVQKARRAAAQAQRVVMERIPDVKTWYRDDPKAKAFVTTKNGRPQWRAVWRRVTKDSTTGRVIEDLVVDSDTSNKLLHRLLPKNTAGTRTILYHNDLNVDNVEVLTTQPKG